MNCLYCGGPTQVKNSRHGKRKTQVWRRRTCTACQAVFTTHEQPELEKSLIINDNGELIPFSNDKLFVSIYDSCKHRKKASEDARALANTVIEKVLASGNSAELLKADLIETVQKTLKAFDTAAYVQYSAFHKQR